MNNAEVLELAAKQLRVVPISRMDGGSSASTWLGRAELGSRVVMKFLAADEGLVDGHDLGTFRRKQAQVAHLRQLAPLVAQRYPRVHAVAHEPGWSAYVFEYIDKPQLVEVIRAHRPDQGAQILAAVWQRLVADGYGQSVRHVNPGTLWDRLYLDRIARRQAVMRSNLPASLFSEGRLVVNGLPVRGLKRLCVEARDLWTRLRGAQLAVPVHGDLNLRNALIEPTEDAGAGLSLIDPRGTVDYWDPFYDLAKMLFSASIFDATMLSGFAVEQSGGREFQVSLRTPRDGLLLDSVLLALPRMARAVGARHEDCERGRLEHLAMAHACHVIAEAACRLSVTQDAYEIRRNRAIGLLLFGMVLLNDLVENAPLDGPRDLSDHLALIR